MSSKPLFASAWREGQRRLIPACEVIEPCWETGKNVWDRIDIRADGQDWGPYAVAAIYRRYETPRGPVVGISMLTVNADKHAVMRRMHRQSDGKRSVVIPRPDEYAEWLHTGNHDATRSMLRLYPADEMLAEPDVP